MHSGPSGVLSGMGCGHNGLARGLMEQIRLGLGRTALLCTAKVTRSRPGGLIAKAPSLGYDPWGAWVRQGSYRVRQGAHGRMRPGRVAWLHGARPAVHGAKNALHESAQKTAVVTGGETGWAHNVLDFKQIYLKGDVLPVTGFAHLLKSVSSCPVCMQGCDIFRFQVGLHLPGLGGPLASVSAIALSFKVFIASWALLASPECPPRQGFGPR